MHSTFRRALLLAATFAPTLSAQSTDTTRKTQPLAAVTVTATRSERSTFDAPQPVTLIDSAQLHAKLAHGIADVFRDLGGLDASGVGPNQRRPEIRGMRGQRILLLSDGLRLNNSRRQQDFGELPALAGINAVDRVEVVRGPSSVLYGTDAIGGVVNLISSTVPRATPPNEVHGALSWRYGSAGNAQTPNGSLWGRFGRFGIRANAAYRESQEYRAPSGSFGKLTLAREIPVFDTGIRDNSYDVRVGFDLTPTTELYTRTEWYQAGKAGFGFVDPAELGGGARVQIVYPDQHYNRMTAGYRARALSLPFVNRADVSVYTQGNDRHFNTFVLAPAGPGATVDSKSYNFTDLATIGGRVELAKAFGRQTLTYGVDAFRDNSENTDSSRTILTGFGPAPITQTSTTPSVPNAQFRSAGVFAQLELNPIDRFSAVLGSRVQDVVAETRATPGITRALVKSSDRTAVWSASALYRVTSDLNAVASAGRGFRAPNLVERFFQGPAAEGNGTQIANPDLVAEESLNGDLGVRYRRGVFFGEGFVFRNDVEHAIRAVATGNVVAGRPEFQNRNVGKLRVDGLELNAGARVVAGVDATASWTRSLAKNVSDPGSPVGDSYSSKVVGDLGYHSVGGRLTAGYTVRFQGEQKDVIVGTNPIGPVIPSFVVHSARASVRLFDRMGTSNRLTLNVDNIANKLYAEFPNASFFRPEPGRNVSIAITSAF